MITEEIRKSLMLAEQQLTQAETELNRPHEDVVTLSACHSIRAAMKTMMHGYLQARNTDIDENSSLESLLGACNNANHLFALIDISDIGCKGMGQDKCDGKYCLSIESVGCCLTSGSQLKALIWADLKVN